MSDKNTDSNSMKYSVKFSDSDSDSDSDSINSTSSDVDVYNLYDEGGPNRNMEDDSGDEYVTDKSEEEEEEDIITNAGHGNFKILDKDGGDIGLCDFKRFKWYLRKGLATKINDRTLQINFDPDYKNNKKEDYEIFERKTLCCACGTKKNLRKFHVVPLQFKRHFPEDKKKHNVTDILLMCDKCAGLGNKITDMFKTAICKYLGITNKTFIDKEKSNIQRCASIIVKNKKNGKPYNYTLDELCKRVGKEPGTLSYQDVYNYSKMDCSKEHNGSRNIGEYITKKFLEQDKLDYFVYKWKRNFMDNVEPKHIPANFITKESHELHGSDDRKN
jgi:hypothetical protein